MLWSANLTKERIEVNATVNTIKAILGQKRGRSSKPPICFGARVHCSFCLFISFYPILTAAQRAYRRPLKFYHGWSSRRLLMSPALWLWLSSKIWYTACASRVFSGAEETTPHEPVSEDDSQEERERKERIPQRKADISRCWSKYCLDLLKTSRDKCVQEVRNGDQGDDDTIAGQGLITVQLLFLFAFTLVIGAIQKPYFAWV